ALDDSFSPRADGGLTQERAGELGEALGLILLSERLRVGDQLKPCVRHRLREPFGVAQLEDVVFRSPGEERRAVEVAQSLERLTRQQRREDANELDRVAPDAAVLEAGPRPALEHLVGDPWLREQARSD